MRLGWIWVNTWITLYFMISISWDFWPEPRVYFKRLTYHFWPQFFVKISKLSLIALWGHNAWAAQKMHPSSWKSVALKWQNSLAHSLPWQKFLFLDWTVKISLRLILTTVQSRKRKSLSRQRDVAIDFCRFWASLFQPLGTFILGQLR